MRNGLSYMESDVNPLLRLIIALFHVVILGIAFFSIAIPCWLLCNLLMGTILRPFGYRPFPFGIFNLVLCLFSVLCLAMVTQPPLAAILGIPLALTVLRIRSQKYIDEEEAFTF